MSGGILNFMPCLRHIMPGFIGYSELMEIHDDLYRFIKVRLPTEVPKY